MSELKNLPVSPVTGKKGTRVIETFSARDIILLYQLQEKIDTKRYFQDDAVYLLECEETGYRFFYPFEIAADKDFYEELHVRSEKDGVDYDRDDAEDHLFALENIEPDAKIVEIGCGSGKFLQKVSKISSDVRGLELNPLIAAKAGKNGFDVQVKLIEDYAKEKPGSLDVVCAFQVLEHITDVRSFLESALTLLKSNGKLIVSVPNNEPYFLRFSKYEVLNLPPHHVGLWNLESLGKLTEIFNLTLEDYKFTGQSTFSADVYLRAKFITNVKSIPRRHSFAEKIKIYGIAPLAAGLSGLDYIRGNRGFAHITAVFRKK